MTEQLIQQIEAQEAAAAEARSRALDCAQSGHQDGLRAANAAAREASDAADVLRARLALDAAEQDAEQRISAAAERNEARREAIELVKSREKHAKRFDAALEELVSAFNVLRVNSREIERALAKAGEPHTGLSGSDVVNVRHAMWSQLDFARLLRLQDPGSAHRQPMSVAAIRRVPAIHLEEEG